MLKYPSELLEFYKLGDPRCKSLGSKINNKLVAKSKDDEEGMLISAT
ncbi:uncharacterized protein G2W53_023838 [Senna tora]|uniref:Uncharacterized protein n=1 Tax=Senna tora TaxID=362788 RepID=A0A834TA75_9FABA|nr:uncharacterized protein G2W53_023838 [Senna tora]